MITKFFKPKITPDSSSVSSPSHTEISDNVNPSQASNKDKILNLGFLESNPAKRK